jgi:hypothetical protein
MTVDGVIDQTDRFIPDGEHEDESYDQLFAADAFVLGRKTCQGWRASGRPSPTTGGKRQANTCCHTDRRCRASDAAGGPECEPGDARLG